MREWNIGFFGIEISDTNIAQYIMRHCHSERTQCMNKEETEELTLWKQLRSTRL